ncbi:MAG TPA: stage II sporulation protein R [Candidatus Mediterraneibacter pullistercoris]|nr:stage II sporulation protein R [Candidatus Mediterraneibacter pullistercoris]
MRKSIEKRAVRICFALSLILASLLTMGMYRRVEAAEQSQLQEHLAEEVLRFHVLANSDSTSDQELKIRVRDAVLAMMEEDMPETASVDETKAWVRSHIDEIEDVSRKTVADAGEEYPVSAAVTTCWFPDRSYGDVTFPAGNYEALRIEIGAAQGHNWWCVLYPGLCFKDAANAVMPDESRKRLKTVLTEEEYSRITADTDFKIGWFFW